MKSLIPALAALLIAVGAASPASAVQDGSALTTTVPAGALTISTYYNVDVYDQQDNKIGDVNDILLDKDGKVQAVIVGVGGFIGVGEKDVAVPFTALKVADKNGNRYLVMNASKEALESAQGYSYDRNQGVWKPVAKS